MKKILIVLLPGLLFFSCNNDVDVVRPDYDPDAFVSLTTPLQQDSKLFMEGVYSVAKGNELLGDQVVVKWSRDRLGIFSKTGRFVNLEGGSIDSAVFFRGAWRYILNTETGIINFQIPAGEGGRSILTQDTAEESIKFTGAYGSGNGAPINKIELVYSRPFSEAVLNSGFTIMAHRGGGRNSDYLGASENTIEIINMAERLGAEGIEIDVQLSKDGVPFLYHDDDINLRLVQKSLIWGDIEDYTWPQIRTLITLVNGEKIPSLRDALEFVVEHTLLKVVWLDIKDTRVLSEAIRIQGEILESAASAGRELSVYIGIPSDEILQSFINYPGYDNIPSLCELGVDEVRRINARVWAPRWTQGLQSAEVTQVQQEGRKAFVWTLDEPHYIEQFINEGHFDAALSNYPVIIAYYHYIR